MRTLLSVLTLLTLASCSSNNGGDAGADAPSDVASDTVGDTANCTGTPCSAFAMSCGAVTDSCGHTNTCGLCRYQAEMVASAGGEVSLAAGSTPQIEYGNSLATRGASGWSSTNLTTTGGASSKYLGMAVAPDGTHWIAYVDTSTTQGVLHVVHDAMGAWTDDTIPMFYSVGAIGGIAVGTDGTPYVAYPGVSGTNFAVSLASYASGSWTVQTVAQVMSPGAVSVAVTVAGTTPMVVWQDIAAHTTSFAAGPSFMVETVDPSVAPNLGPGQLAITADASGRAHVAYLVGSLNEAQAGILHAVRTAPGTWAIDSVDSGYRGDPSIVRIAAAPNGTLAIAYVFDLAGLEVAMSGTGGGWIHQTVVRRCESNAGFDLGFDASGTLAVAHACVAELKYLALQGPYPSGYPTQCTQLATTLCMAGCTCEPGSTNCCVVSQNTSLCAPIDSCIAGIFTDVCGDASQDPSAITPCTTDAAQSMCSSPDASHPGLVVASTCEPLFQ